MPKPNQPGNSSRPNADEMRKPGQPKYQPVEQADDEEIAQSQRQTRSTNPADNVPVQVSGEDLDSDDLGEEEWMDEDGNDVSSEERIATEEEEDSNETSGGRRPGKPKGRRGGDSPRP